MPLSCRCATASSRSPALRDVSMILAPASPSASAICSPRPREPPVTSACWPVRSNSLLMGVDIETPGDSEHFEHAGRAHAATDAHRDAHALGAAALAFDQRMTGEALAAHAIRMADGDRAAVDVELVHRDAELVGAIQHLHRERFIELPQIDVAHLQPQALQHLGHRERRADAHLVGLAAGHRKAEEAADRLEILLLRVAVADHHAGTGAVAELAGVAGGDHAAGNRWADVL